MQHNFGVGRRLKDCAGGDELLTQRNAVGKVAVMRNRDAANFQLCEQWLHIAQDCFTSRGIAYMTDGAIAGQAVQRRGIGEVVAHQSHMPFRMKATVVVGHNTRCFLSAMLKGMQAQSGQRCGVLMAKNAKYTALFMQRIIV